MVAGEHGVDGSHVQQLVGRVLKRGQENVTIPHPFTGEPTVMIVVWRDRGVNYRNVQVRILCLCKLQKCPGEKIMPV